MKESFYSWGEYSLLFKQKARGENLSEDNILELLNYSYSLHYRKLPIIFDINHLSYLTEYRLEYINRAIARPANFYRRFKIPKKNGHTREISEPLPGLKAIQYWILENILSTRKPNRLNNAYNIGKSIKSNAKYHIGQKIVLNIDIENYFQSIGKDKIHHFYHQLGYNDAVATILTQLCTLDDGLPQGSPTSPSISNLITANMDVELLTFCTSNNLKYSRYADDITISGAFNVGEILNRVKEILKAHDFHINKNKIKVKRPHQRQTVTGLVVNKKISVRKQDIKKVRQELYYIKKFGFFDHVKKIQINKRNYMEHLLGKINYFLFISPENTELNEYKKYLNLLSRADE